MYEPSLNEFVEYGFSRVTERGVTEVVSQSAGFGEVLVEFECTGNRPTYLRHFEGVSKTGAVVVAFGREKDLSLVFESSKGFAMNYSVPITLKFRAHIVGRARKFTTFGIAR